MYIRFRVGYKHDKKEKKNRKESFLVCSKRGNKGETVQMLRVRVRGEGGGGGEVEARGSEESIALIDPFCQGCL